MSNNKVVYTPEFKIMIAKEYESGNYGGVRGVAKKFNVSKNLVWRSHKQLMEKGEESFLIKKKRKKVATSKATKTSYKSMSIEEKLEYKEMECDILKKYHALLKQLGEL